MGEARKDALRLNFDRRLKLEFHGTKLTSDAGLSFRDRFDILLEKRPSGVDEQGDTMLYGKSQFYCVNGNGMEIIKESIK